MFTQMSFLTKTTSLDGDMRRVISSEKGRVNVDAIDVPWDPQLDDAPVMTFMTRQTRRISRGEGRHVVVLL